jgi:hypothetical protein
MTTSRHYPYVGATKDNPRGDMTGPYFDAVPTWLNDLLLEQTPGREMRSFRLAVRKAWLEAQERREAPQMARLERAVHGTTGVASDVVQTVMFRMWMQAWPQTREEEERRDQEGPRT